MEDENRYLVQKCQNKLLELSALRTVLTRVNFGSCGLIRAADAVARQDR